MSAIELGETGSSFQTQWLLRLYETMLKVIQNIIKRLPVYHNAYVRICFFYVIPKSRFTITFLKTSQPCRPENDSVFPR